MAKKQESEKKEKKNWFSFKERLAHYTGIANGTIKTKKDSKFKKQSQIDYAKGQRDALNNQKIYYGWKNASKEERDAYKAKQKAKREAYYAQKNAVSGVNVDDDDD